jgi:aspartyl-tRNA(Asn)/glutamyl-tRNA(Gln) amidotransferase subunit A
MPLAASMDHPGPIAGCVRDLAVMLQTVAGNDPYDPLSSAEPVPDYVAEVSRPLRPPRLGWLRGPFEERADAAVRAMVERVASGLRAAGAAVHEVALPAAFAEVFARHRTVMAVEAAAFHEPRLRRHPEDYLPKVRALLDEGLACSAAEYARCKEHQRELTAAVRDCFGGIDALLCPATTSPAPDKDTTGDPAFQAPWSYTGLPTVSFLTGYEPDGLPLCVQLVGREWDEARLFQAAAWCEDALALERQFPA